MSWRARGAAAALFASLAACTPTNTTNPPAFDAAAYPAIHLAVESVEVASAAQYPAGMGFIARRRSEQLAQDAQAFLRARLVAAGGDEFARATVEEASLVEQARPTNEGSIASATELDWEIVGVLALKVVIVDELGIEQSFANSRVEIKRNISEHTSVEAKETFAQQNMNYLIAASSTELQTSIKQNIPDRFLISSMAEIPPRPAEPAAPPVPPKGSSWRQMFLLMLLSP